MGLNRAQAKFAQETSQGHRGWYWSNWLSPQARTSSEDTASHFFAAQGQPDRSLPLPWALHASIFLARSNRGALHYPGSPSWDVSISILASTNANKLCRTAHRSTLGRLPQFACLEGCCTCPIPISARLTFGESILSYVLPDYWSFYILCALCILFAICWLLWCPLASWRIQGRPFCLCSLIPQSSSRIRRLSWAC